MKFLKEFVRCKAPTTITPVNFKRNQNISLSYESNDNCEVTSSTSISLLESKHKTQNTKHTNTL